MPMLSIYPLKIGGAEIYSYKLASHLSKLNNHLTVLVPAVNGMTFHDLIISNTFKISYFPYIKIKLISGLIYSVGLIIKTLTLIRKSKRFDLIHAHTGIYPMIGGFILSKLLRIPFFITCHGSDIRINRKNTVLKLIQNYIFQRSKCVIVVSNELKTILKDEIRNLSIEIVPAGVDKNSFKDLPHKWSNKTRVKVLFVGNLRKIKNPKIILEALKKLKQYEFNIELIMIGTGPLYEALKVFCNQYDLTNVIFIPQVPHKNLHQYYKKADLFVMPSLSEGTPLALLDAMASGLPIIASKIGGISDLIKNNYNGILIEPTNIDLLVDKIKYLIENPEIAEKLGKNAQKSSNLISWDIITKNHIAIYQRYRK